MNIHFIAIGGSAMHNLAIALSKKGENITGSDDEIFEPSKGRLKREGILPETIGWNENNIHTDLNAVILGMHARENNPELLKAKALNIPIYSYPEYLYEQAKNKKRIVIGGSHGKTTITSMLLHVVNHLKLNVDYMVGAQLDGYDCMVKITKDANLMILEGDEYLSSPIDRRPKFHLYHPDVALMSGIAWDHINVFPTWPNYIEQFEIFADKITENGTLVYNCEDEEVKKIGENTRSDINTIAYKIPNYEIRDGKTILTFDNAEYPLQIFGAHNLQNMMGAMEVAKAMGIAEKDFLKAIQSFTGAGKRLEKVFEKDNFVLFKDFAHSPSKLRATTSAVKEQYEERRFIACMELHTFSSLKKEFLSHYKDTMVKADHALVYFSHDVVKHKKLEPITAGQVKEAFGGNVKVVTSSTAVMSFLKEFDYDNTVLLMMSSGNFDGIDYNELATELK